jgi:hypothetical protein
MTARIATASAALLAAAALAVASAGPSKAVAWPALRTAGPFLLDEIRMKVDGRWGVAWSSLYPLHRLVASRSAFVRCETRDPFVLPVDSMRVLRVSRTAVRVPGLARVVSGVAVTLRTTFLGPGPRDPIVFTHTFHLVPVHGRWTWLLSLQRYRLYRNGACSSAPAV